MCRYHHHCPKCWIGKFDKKRLVRHMEKCPHSSPPEFTPNGFLISNRVFRIFKRRSAGLPPLVPVIMGAPVTMVANSQPTKTEVTSSDPPHSPDDRGDGALLAFHRTPAVVTTGPYSIVGCRQRNTKCVIDNTNPTRSVLNVLAVSVPCCSCYFT